MILIFIWLNNFIDKIWAIDNAKTFLIQIYWQFLKLLFEIRRSRYASLNKHHAYFLLVDNGTVGKYGAEIALRRKLEKFISTQSLSGSRGMNLYLSIFL